MNFNLKYRLFLHLSKKRIDNMIIAFDFPTHRNSILIKSKTNTESYIIDIETFLNVNNVKLIDFLLVSTNK